MTLSRKSSKGAPKGPSIKQLAEELRGRIEDVLAYYHWDPIGHNRSKGEWRADALDGSRGSKICVYTAGTKRGYWTSFSGPLIAGRKKDGGDALWLIAAILNRTDCKDPTVIAEAKRILGYPADGAEDANAVRARQERIEADRRQRQTAEQQEAEDREAEIRRLRGQYAALRHKAVENDFAREYFRGRGLHPDLIPPWIGIQVRRYWHGTHCLGSFPCLVSPIVRSGDLPETNLVALHLTYLDGEKPEKVALRDPETGEALPAKKFQGSADGGCIELAQINPHAPDVLFVAEGIETGLSIKAIKPGWAGWAAASVGNFSRLTIPRGIRHLLFIEDGDSKPAKDKDGKIRRNPDGSPLIPAIAAVDQAVELYGRQIQLSGEPLKVSRWRAPAGRDANDLVRGPMAPVDVIEVVS